VLILWSKVPIVVYVAAQHRARTVTSAVSLCITEWDSQTVFNRRASSNVLGEVDDVVVRIATKRDTYLSVVVVITQLIASVLVRTLVPIGAYYKVISTCGYTCNINPLARKG